MADPKLLDLWREAFGAWVVAADGKLDKDNSKAIEKEAERREVATKAFEALGDYRPIFGKSLTKTYRFFGIQPAKFRHYQRTFNQTEQELESGKPIQDCLNGLHIRDYYLFEQIDVFGQHNPCEAGYAILEKAAQREAVCDALIESGYSRFSKLRPTDIVDTLVHFCAAIERRLGRGDSVRQIHARTQVFFTERAALDPAKRIEAWAMDLEKRTA